MNSDADMYLAQLLDMGYPIEQAVTAIEHTKATGLGEAVSWILDVSVSTSSPAPYSELSKPTPTRTGDGSDPELGHSSRWQKNPAYDTHTPLQAFSNNNRVLAASMSSEQERAAKYPLVTRSTCSQLQYPHHNANQPQQQRQQSHQQQQPAGPYEQSHQQRQGDLLCREAVTQSVSPDQRPSQPSPRPPTMYMSGVAALLDREQRRTSAASDVMDTALQDLQALMQQAQDMVELAQQFRTALAKQPLETVDEQVALDGLAEELLSIGIEAPVTKAAAGKHFYMQLARELKTFLPLPMERAGGYMTLLDVFCLFNRARGLDLVTPDDLLQAVKLLELVGAPFEVQHLEDGALVLRSTAHSTQQVCQRMSELAAGDGSGGLGSALTVHGVAISLRLPIAVAQKQLLTAEAFGALCRDEGGVSGLRFYRNFFLDLGV